MEPFTTSPEEFIEVGRMALRDPKTGGFLPSVKLYIKATPEARESESALIGGIAHLFADKMKQYIDDGGIVPKTGGRFS